MVSDAEYMKRAIELAYRGRGWVDPNPMVGCVIVKDNHIIGEGWHKKFGGPHAEREALADCAARGYDVRGACVYVTLEPCSHFGKTPPCADALIEAEVSRVVIGSADPNPQVAGQGIARIKDAGIEVCEGVMRQDCDKLNVAFFHWISTSLPLVIAKYAMTLDGKIATRTGASKWITGEVARRRVHEDRARYAAVMVGVGTVIADDPMLTARLDDVSGDLADADNFGGNGGALPVHQPTRVICDTHLRTPLDCKIVQSCDISPVLIATCNPDTAKQRLYQDAGCAILHFEEQGGRVPMQKLISKLGEMGIDSVIVEGGSSILGAVFDEGLVDMVQTYIAPKVIGGVEAASPVGGRGVDLPSSAHMFDDVCIERLGKDVLIEARLCLQG